MMIFAERRRYQRSPDSDLFCAKESLSGDSFKPVVAADMYALRVK